MNRILTLKNLLLTLTISLLFFNFLLLNKLKGDKKHVHEFYVNDTLRIESLKTQINILETKDWLQMESGQKRLNPNLELINENQQPIRLEELLDGQKKLVFRYSELNCHQCVDSAFKSLKSLVKEIGEEKVIILASYSRFRSLALFKRLNQLKMDVYNINEEALGIPLERSGIPFMFLLDKEYKTKFVFVPEKTMPQLTENYFHLMKEQLK